MRFSDSGSQDGIDRWELLGVAGRPSGRREAAGEAVEGGPECCQTLWDTRSVQNNHTNPLEVPTGDANRPEPDIYQMPFFRGICSF